MGVAEMRMLRGMCGHTRNDKIGNEDIRGKVGVAEIEGKMRENRFRFETAFIKKIVDENIWQWLPRKNELNVAKHPVGINSRIQDIVNHLSSGGSNVVMVGIWGMGGLGKTTAAKAIYNQIHHKFQFRSFLADISYTARRHGLVYLQNKLVCDILKQTPRISSVDEGISLIRQQFQHRRVLVIVDNIDEVEQLYAIAGNHDWFGPGSRIVITTRDEHLLRNVDKVYQVQKLNEGEALKLFSWHAFGNSCPHEGYLEHSKDVVSYCGGLPVALEVLEWESQLEKLERIPEGQVIKPLRISFDGLDDIEKAIFLDISCFFIGRDKNYAAKVLDGCGFFATTGINVLRERCLITVEGNKLNMHDLFREMARVIIFEKSPGHPEKWSRLWNPQEVIDSIPDDFFDQPRLVILDMQWSRLVDVWEGSKSLQKLKVLDLSFSYYLKNSPNFSKLPNLEELILERCYSLSEIDPSIGHLKRLSFVNLSSCYSLSSLPRDFYKSISVETLCLNDCSKFKELHEGIGEMISLRILEADATAIRQVPPSILRLKKLTRLSLKDVKSIHSSYSLHGLSSLRELNLSQCKLDDDAIPRDIGSLISLQDLDLRENNFHTLPSLSGLSKLETLWLSECRYLHTIPDLPTNLKFMYAVDCPALETMPNFSEMSNMRQLNVSDSPKLTEVQGLDESLNSMTWIDMQGCTNLTVDFRKNILQGWTSCGFGGIVLHGNYVPDWFEFVNGGNKVNFDIPLNDGRNFEGLTLFCLYSSGNRFDRPLPLTIITVTNNAKCTELRTCIGREDRKDITYDKREAHYIWQGQLSNDKLNLQGGDQVEVEVTFGEIDFSGKLKRTGVNLVWDKPLRENMHDLDRAGYAYDASDNNHLSNQMIITTDDRNGKRQKIKM
ncbi:unnamed protein product [Malus baccata var. baccata]